MAAKASTEGAGACVATSVGGMTAVVGVDPPTGAVPICEPNVAVTGAAYGAGAPPADIGTGWSLLGLRPFAMSSMSASKRPMNLAKYPGTASSVT